MYKVNLDKRFVRTYILVHNRELECRLNHILYLFTENSFTADKYIKYYSVETHKSLTNVRTDKQKVKRDISHTLNIMRFDN